MFIYIANLNYKILRQIKPVVIEQDNPISTGELLGIDESRFIVTQVRHVISEKGTQTYLDCDQCT